MAGWMCQTRKIISALLSSLADDLEQTVQELNDVMYRLGSTHEDKSPSQSETLPVDIPQNERPHFEQTSPHQLKATSHEPGPDDQQQAFASSEQLRATQTTQPEASGFPSTLNARLSQSTPALQMSEDTISVAGDKCVGTRQLMLKSSLHSLVSSSSPCLTNTPAQPSDRASVVNSEHRFRQPDLYSKSFKQTMTSDSQKVCPCHRQDSLKITRGMKHPGRVIRTQSSITLEQEQSSTREDPTQSPAMEEHNHSFNQSSCIQIPCGKHDQNVDSPRCASDPKGGEPGSQRAGGATSSLVLMEHHAQILRWASLRPLTRMLSFAFAQLANVALIFSNNSQSVNRLTSSPSALGKESKRHDAASAMHPLGIPEQGQMETTCKRHVSEQEAQQPSVLQRTYSTDSFEILESPGPAGVAERDKGIQRIISECQAHQAYPGPVCEALDARVDISSSHFGCAHPRPACGALDARVDISSSHFGCAHPHDRVAALPGMPTSSTDFVCFDFRKLLTDGQFRGDNPMLQSSCRGSADVTSCSIESDFLVVGGDCLNQSVSGDSSSSCQHSCHHNTDRDENNYDDDDDDGDSSSSFIILSGNDINNAELTF